MVHVFEALAQSRQVSERDLVLADQLLAERLKVAGYDFPPLIKRHELTELLALLAEDSRHTANIGRLGTPQPLAKEHRGHVDAGQDVADVVQDAGGDFRHARLARRCTQLLMYP